MMTIEARKSRNMRTIMYHDMDKNRWKKIATFILITTFILFGTYNVVFTMVALLLCCVIICIKDNDYCVEMLYFILSMAPIFKLSSSGSSVYTYIVLLYCTMHIAKKRFVLNKVETLVLIFTLYILATSVCSGTVNTKRIVKMCANTMMIGLLSDIDIDKKYRNVFFAYILGLILSSCMRFLNSSFFRINEYTVEVIMHEPTYSTVRFAGLYNDPNYYAINVIIALVLTTVLYQRRDIDSIGVVLLSIPLIYFAGMTGSKSALLMLSLPLCLLTAACIKRKNYLMMIIFVLAVAVGIEMILSGRFTAFNVTLNRMQRSSKNLTGVTSNRDLIWKNYFAFLKNNPHVLLIGNSVGIYYLDGFATHNTYIDLLYQFGIVGTMIFISIVIISFKEKVRNRPRSILNYGVLICILTMYFFLSQLQEFDLPFHIVLCLMVMNLNMNETNDKRRT